MHGSWKLDEDIVIVALRLGTEFGWAKIEEEFNKFFPNAPAVRKDIESRYNKTLKPERDDPQTANVADVIDDYRHYRRLPANRNHAEWVHAALRVLDGYPEDRIIKPNPGKSLPVLLLGFAYPPKIELLVAAADGGLTDLQRSKEGSSRIALHWKSSRKANVQHNTKAISTPFLVLGKIHSMKSNWKKILYRCRIKE